MRPNIAQNLRYVLISFEAKLYDGKLWFSNTQLTFCYKFMLKSPRMYISVLLVFMEHFQKVCLVRLGDRLFLLLLFRVWQWYLKKIVFCVFREKRLNIITKIVSNIARNSSLCLSLSQRRRSYSFQFSICKRIV